MTSTSGVVLMSDIGASLPPPPELIAIGQSSLNKLGQKSSASGCWRMDRAETRP
jgi:hypothetical protein